MGWTVLMSSHGDLNELQGDNLCIHGLHHVLQGNLCSRTCNTSSSPHFGVYRSVSMTFSLLLSHNACTAFCPFLNMPPQRRHHVVWGAQLCPAVAPLEWLEPAVFITGQSQSPAPEAFSSPPSSQHLDTCSQYNPNGYLIQSKVLPYQHLLSCLSTGSPTKFENLAASLCLLRKWRKEYQHLIHTNSVFSKSIWKLACRNSRLGWQFGICKLLLALNKTGISLTYLSLLYCRVYKATVTQAVEFVVIQKD